MDIKGRIFDIKEFTIHDGPGARVTVFMKGCPLKCVWCHNPEGMDYKKQLMHKKNICSDCGRCRQYCNHEECKPYGRCIYACANNCLSVAGEDVTRSELAQKLKKYEKFFKMSGGGITISGGEPLLQSEFVCDLTDKLFGIHTAIQTSGYADEETYARVISKFDYIMQDIKLADEESHIKYTGLSNKKILLNIEYLKSSNKEFVFRLPLIPNITDTEENLTALSEIVGSHKVELLSYNPLAGAKYEMLGMKYAYDVLENEKKDYTKYFINSVLR